MGFGLTLALLLSVAGLGVHRMSSIENNLEEIVDSNNAEARLAVAMRIAVNQAAAATRNMVLLEKGPAMAEEEERLKLAREHYNAAEDELGRRLAASTNNATGELALFEKIRSLKEVVRPLNDKSQALGRAGKPAEATAVLMNELDKPQQEWFHALGDLADLQAKLTAADEMQAKASYRTARLGMLGLAGFALVVAAAAGVLITRRLLAQLGGEPELASEIARAIAAGDLSTPIPLRAGDTSSMLHAMRQMQISLGRLVSSIRAGADSIATGTTQIATGNADLSQRTEEQASNLQQTAASMEQLTQVVKSNADAARQATQLAAHASECVTQGNDAVAKVVTTMGGISTSSAKIADIIAVIDGIAFQTNILALNAAVEAARAGEQGRGFAVVAGEVHSLAGRCSQAAKEIKNLIEDSACKVAVGGDQVAEAGETMHDILASVRRVSDLMGEIDAATNEQSRGISQVGNAVGQLDQVTQQNAALVEESAAAADSLRSQADRLVQSVAVFRLPADDNSALRAQRAA